MARARAFAAFCLPPKDAKRSRSALGSFRRLAPPMRPPRLPSSDMYRRTASGMTGDSCSVSAATARKAETFGSELGFLFRFGMCPVWQPDPCKSMDRLCKTEHYPGVPGKPGNPGTPGTPVCQSVCVRTLPRTIPSLAALGLIQSSSGRNVGASLLGRTTVRTLGVSGLPPAPWEGQCRDVPAVWCSLYSRCVS